jgi:uncharacterized protein with ATP-grasp and redox domains
MKACALNIPNILARVLATAQLVTEDDWLHKKVLFDIMELLSTIDFDRTATEVSFDCLRKAYKILGSADPYVEQKKLAIDDVVAHRVAVEQWLETQKDPFHSMLALATAANRHMSSPFDREAFITLAMDDATFGIHHYVQLLTDLDEAQSVLYILDNSDEAVFDYFVVKELVKRGKEVTVAVRSEAILDDATCSEAEYIGFEDIADVITPGADMLGIILSLANRKFQSSFYEADLVIAKGVANFETLCTCKRDVYFMLVGTGTRLPDYLNVELDELVLLKGGKDVNA